MAITIEYEAQSLVTTGAGAQSSVLLSRAKLVSTFSSTSTAQTNFKYLVQVEEDGTEIFKSYVTANPAGRCMFDLSGIVKDRIERVTKETASGLKSIHDGMYSTFPVTKCDNNQNIYTVKVGEVYEVSGTLTEFPNLQNFDVLIISGVQDYKDFTGNGAVQLNLVPYSLDCIAPVELQKGFLSGIDSDTYTSYPKTEFYRDLAGASIAVPTRETDLGGLSWIHDSTYIGNDSDSIIYTWYNDAGTSLGTWTYDVTDPANGGQALGSTDPEGKVLCAPFHWGSMSNNGSVIGTFTNALAWTYVTIQLLRSDSSAANFKWCVYKDCDGNKNELYQLAWDNGVGFYDYFSFKPMTEHEESAEKKQYNTNVGSYSATDFTILPFEAGKKNYQVVPKRSWTLTSGKIDENLSQYLKNIIKARKVDLILPDGSVLPVVVDTNSTKFYRDRTNKLYDFQVKVTLAQSLEG